MTDRIDELAYDLEQVAESAQANFGGLSPSQLNWRPMADSWSIAQCLDHLITMNSFYFPLLESLKTGAPKPTFWEQYSPLSRLFGRLLIRSMAPGHPRKVKTISQAEPSKREIDAGILNRFAEHQAELIDLLRGILPSIDRERTIVTSPLLSLVTYNLDDCLTLLVVHELRHLEQAKRVMEAEAFPALA